MLKSFTLSMDMLKKYRSNCIIPDEIEKEIIVLIDF